MDELRELLMRIEDPELRDQILRALERRGEATPEALFEEIRRAIDQLNSEAALRQVERVLGPLDALPRFPDREIQVVYYGPQPAGNTGDGPVRWRDSTSAPTQWYGDGTQIVSSDTVVLGDD